MAIWLEGRELAEKIKQDVRERVQHFERTRHEAPGLIGVLVGDNEASQIYLRSKEKACRAVGIASQVLTFPADIEPAALKAEIEELNRREDVDGILGQQLPVARPVSTPTRSSAPWPPPRTWTASTPSTWATSWPTRTGRGPARPPGSSSSCGSTASPWRGKTPSSSDAA